MGNVDSIPEEVKEAIFTLGKFCRGRHCKDCAFARNSDYPFRCVFEQEHNPCWLVEDVFGTSGVDELYLMTKEDQ